jgi:galactosamine-6-phosphate isomerase
VHLIYRVPLRYKSTSISLSGLPLREIGRYTQGLSLYRVTVEREDAMKDIVPIVFETADDVGVFIAEQMADLYKKIPDAITGVCTGESPKPAYKHVVRFHDAGRFSSERLRFVKVDEYLGMPLDDPRSCESFLRTLLIGPLGIPDERYISFDSMPVDEVGECARVEMECRGLGRPFDRMLLGLGADGHFAMNHSAAMLKRNAHVEELSGASRRHTMLDGTNDITRGSTLGTGTILSSKQILLIVTGKAKALPLRRLIYGKKDTSKFAASCLEEGNVLILADEAAASAL